MEDIAAVTVATAMALHGAHLAPLLGDASWAAMIGSWLGIATALAWSAAGPPAPKTV
jgi:hypothetical protein